MRESRSHSRSAPMKRPFVYIALLIAGMLATACGATMAPNNAARVTEAAVVGASTATLASTIDALPSTTAASATAASAGQSGAVSGTSKAPVTAIMSKLGITGEPFSAQGDPQAPLTVIEFSDYGCPFCRRYFDATYPQVKAQYIDTGKIYYVFKDFPIVQIHPQAPLAAEAARCAGEQGKYWEMHAALFAAPSEWDTTENAALTAFGRYAKAIKLKESDFSACLRGHRYQPMVEAAQAQGLRLGVTGTPTFIINGKLLTGAHPFSVFKNAINRELKSKQ